MSRSQHPVTELAPRYDTIVVGAGLGGLLAAAVAAKDGRTVLVVERLPYLGGRFTTVEQDGVEITTGALHLVPHGQRGPLGQLLRELGITHREVPRDAYASIWYQGRHVIWRRPLDIFALAGSRGVADFLRVVAALAVAVRWNPNETFSTWLSRRATDRLTRLLFERFIEFALSVRTDQISCGELAAVVGLIFRHGLPRASEGGCRTIVDSLAGFVRARGGAICSYVEVTEIIRDPLGRAVGVRVRDRSSGECRVIEAGQVVSDAGPAATESLLRGGDRETRAAPWPTANGLKLHVVSTRSLIPHNGIMFCLDTRRVSGIVQVSNAVPSVVSPGTHMLDTFQVLQSDDIAEERHLAVEDLRQVFGTDYDRHCRVVRASAFRRRWPVNRVTQGSPPPSQTPVPGLVMVGDAYKSPGCMMVEGVASSVWNVLPILTSSTHRR